MSLVAAMLAFYHYSGEITKWGKCTGPITLLSETPRKGLAYTSKQHRAVVRNNGSYSLSATQEEGH
jgi:hypothetical protein